MKLGLSGDAVLTHRFKLMLVLAIILGGPPLAFGEHGAKPGGSGTDQSAAGGSAAAADAPKSDSGGSKGSAGQQTPSAPSSPSNTAPIESQILAYASLNSRARQIAAFMLESVGSARRAETKLTFIVLEPNQITYLESFKSFSLQASSLKRQFCAALSLPTKRSVAGGPQPQSLAAGAAGVSAAAAAVSATLQLFKETRTVTPNTITLPDEALVAAVGEQFANDEGVRFFYPSEVPLGLSAVPAPFAPPTSFEAECHRDDKADSVYQRLTILQFLRLVSEDRATSLKTRKANELAPVQSALDALVAVNKSEDAILASWSAPDATTGKTIWDAVLRGEQLSLKLKDNAYLVELKVQSSGGEVVSLDGLFFLTGASYHYSGGAIITVILFDPDTGFVKASRNFWEMSGDVNRKSFDPRQNSASPALHNCLTKASSGSDTAARNTQILSCVGE
jgi:hypothetical protein